MKYSGYDENELFTIINPVCQGFNAKIVQLNSTVIRTTMQVRIVLYKKGGININTCSEISRAVLPRIEIWADNRDVNLEVSSPGICRTLKDAYEFNIFKDESINILIDNEWLNGKIISSDKNTVTIQSGQDCIEYNFENIQKAKLN